MSTAILPALLAPLLALIAKSIGQGPRVHRSIERHLRLYEALPDASTSKTDLLAHVDAMVADLVLVEQTKRRDWSGIGVAGFLLLGGASMGAVAMSAGHGRWWSWLWGVVAVFAVLIGIGGMVSSVPLAERDEAGNRRKASDEPSEGR